MSTPITARANVAISKRGNVFTRNRYRLALYVEDVYTGLSWQVTRRQAKRMPQAIVDNAAFLLQSFGLMDSVHAMVSAKQDGIPAEGVKVKLTTDLGPTLPIGTVGVIIKRDAMVPGIAPEHQYPVVAEIGPDDCHIPLAIHEFEVVK